MNGIKMSTGERVFKIFNGTLLILLSVIFLLPFVSILATSFIGEAEYIRRGSFILFPESIDFNAYKVLFDRGSVILQSYLVTLFRVVVGTFLNLFFTATLAYGLARKNIPGQKLFILIIFVAMIFSGGLIPTYVLIDNIGLTDSIWALVIPGLINPFYFFIMRAFFLNIPKELEESALIDGASPPVILLKIILPISIPTFVTIGLFYAVWHWNSWFDAAIYINDVRKLPVQNIMRSILMSGTVQDAQNEVMMQDVMPPPLALRSAIIIISTIPIMCIYPFIQKYFVQGVTLGSVKG